MRHSRRRRRHRAGHATRRRSCSGRASGSSGRSGSRGRGDTRACAAGKSSGGAIRTGFAEPELEIGLYAQAAPLPEFVMLEHRPQRLAPGSLRAAVVDVLIWHSRLEADPETLHEPALDPEPEPSCSMRASNARTQTKMSSHETEEVGVRRCASLRVTPGVLDIHSYATTLGCYQSRALGSLMPLAPRARGVVHDEG